jgi:hypothetical protein
MSCVYDGGSDGGGDDHLIFAYLVLILTGLEFLLSIDVGGDS